MKNVENFGKTVCKIITLFLLCFMMLFSDVQVGDLSFTNDVQAAAKTTLKYGNTVYSIQYNAKKNKTFIYQKKGSGKKKQIGSVNRIGYSGFGLLFKYGNKLYFYIYGEDCPHLMYVNLSTQKTKYCEADGGCMPLGSGGFTRYGRYLPYISLTGLNSDGSWKKNLCILDLKTGTRKIIEKNCQYACVIGKKIYCVRTCKSYSSGSKDIQVFTCSTAGKSKKTRGCKIRITGWVTKLTESSVYYRTDSVTYSKCYTSSQNTTVTPKVTISTGSTGGNSCYLTGSTNISGQQIYWKSSNTGIATVSNGKVTAKSSGTVTITAYIIYGGKTYTAKKEVVVSSQKSYGSWSSWSLTAATASSTIEVQTTALYRYYYFYCPVCGGREPYQGLSDCHQYSLKLSDGHVGWFPTPYSKSNSRTYSYSAAKSYTTSLGDGKIWNFTTAEINCNTIGYYSSEALDTIIRRGYRTRTIYTNYYIKSVN